MLQYLRITNVLFLLVVFAANAPAQSINPAVFVTNNVGDSVSSFTVNPNGTLSFAGVFASGDGPQTLSLSPDGEFLAVANGTSSTTTEELRIFQVNSDATLTSLLTTTVPDSPLDVQWMSNSILAVTDTTVFSANHVQLFEYDTVNNLLSLVDMESTGLFNSRLETARNGSLLFANNSLGANSVFAFSVDANGEATLIEEQSTGTSFAVALEASPDGNFLYGPAGTSGNDDQILSFTIDAGGSLIPGPTWLSPGDSPASMDITQDGLLAIVGHGADATFRSFFRDAVTGALVPTGEVFDVGLQGTLGDLQIMGDLLFVTDESTAIDGITGIYSFRINPDGSFTQLGPIMSTMGTRPEYIATWQGLVVVPEPASAGVLSLVMLLASCQLRRRRRPR